MRFRGRLIGSRTYTYSPSTNPTVRDLIFTPCPSSRPIRLACPSLPSFLYVSFRAAPWRGVACEHNEIWNIVNSLVTYPWTLLVKRQQQTGSAAIHSRGWYRDAFYRRATVCSRPSTSRQSPDILEISLTLSDIPIFRHWNSFSQIIIIFAVSVNIEIKIAFENFFIVCIL